MRSDYKNLLRTSYNYLGFGFSHYFFSCLGQTFLISVFVKYFTKDIGISNDSFSFVYALATISSAFVLSFIGSFVDKIKIRYFSLVNGLALSIFCLIVSQAFNIYTLFFALLGLRLTGQSLMPLTGSTSVARYFDKERGRALSLSSVGLALSETIMPSIAILLINLVGWQTTWQIFALAIWLIFIPISLLSVSKNDPFQLIRKDGILMGDTVKELSRKDVLRDRKFYLIIPAVVFIPFFITGLFIHHNILAEHKGWTIEWIATCFIGYGICKTLTTFIVGPLIDKFSAKKIFPLHMVPLMIGILFLLVSNNSFTTLIYLCLAGVSTSLASISTTAMWTEIYGYKHLGAIKSMVTTISVFSSALGPVVLGYFMKDPYGWFVTMILSIFAMMVLSITANLALFHKNPTVAFTRVFRLRN